MYFPISWRVIYKCTSPYCIGCSAVFDKKWHDPSAPPSLLTQSCLEWLYFPVWRRSSKRVFCWCGRGETKNGCAMGVLLTVCVCNLDLPYFVHPSHLQPEHGCSLPCFDLMILLLGIYPKNPESPIWKNLCIRTFIAALFTIVECCKQPNCPSGKWVDQKIVVHLHNWILCNRKKEGTPTFCDSVYGTEEYYAKWNKAVSESQLPYDLTYKRNLMKKIN